jgi:hypothetical protein
MAAEMVDLISAAESCPRPSRSLSQWNIVMSHCTEHIPEKEATIPTFCQQPADLPACRDRNGETGCGPAIFGMCQNPK